MAVIREALTGDALYRLYERASLRRGVRAPEWGLVPVEERAIWEDVSLHLEWGAKGDPNPYVEPTRR